MNVTTKTHASDDPTLPVVVLGAKPDAPLPLVRPRVVISANGAVEIARTYRDRYGARVIVLVPGVELLKHPHIQVSFRKGDPDEIVVFGDGGVDIVHYIRHELCLTRSTIRVYSLRERHQFMRAVLKWRILLVVWERLHLRGIRHFLGKALPDLFFRGNMEWLSHSTGLDAIMYALTCFPDSERVIAAGIGLQGGAHFNAQGEFMEKTARADRDTFKHWPHSWRTKLRTTDEALHTVGHVQKWDGDTFRFSSDVP